MTVRAPHKTERTVAQAAPIPPIFGIRIMLRETFIDAETRTLQKEYCGLFIAAPTVEKILPKGLISERPPRIARIGQFSEYFPL